jgi:hypothetical protein
LKGKNVVLIGMFTVKLGEISEFVTNEVSEDTPKIHWVSTPNIKIKIVMPNGNEVEAIAENDVKELKEGDIVQFYRIGFCRLDNKKEMVFYFAHK